MRFALKPMDCLFIMVLALSHANSYSVTLKVLEWEGYISPFSEAFSQYAKRHGLEIELEIVQPYISDPEYIFNQLRAGKADVVTPTHNYFKMNGGRLFEVLKPLTFDQLVNYPKILATLRHAKYDERDGNKHSVPLLGGSYGLAYNADKVSAPISWEILWQPQSTGKYAVTNDQFEANFYITMLTLGYPPDTFYNIENSNFNRTEVQDKLDALVSNAHSFWAGMADAEKMLNLNYVTTYWFGVADANKQGQNWRLAQPQEGQTVWLDTLSIGAHVSGEKLQAAYLLIDFMISETIQKQIMELYGSIIVNSETAKLLKPDAIKSGRVGDESFFNEQYFWKPLSARTRNIYKQMWKNAREKIK